MKRVLFALLFGSLAAASGAGAADGNLADAVNRKVLRVCATPANLPYSDEKGEGFENKIADLIAQELKRASVEYTWFPQGMGFVRKTLSEKRCDLVMGTVQADEFTLNTNPYYRTTYALIVRPGSGLEDVKSMFDPRLKGKKVGVQAGSPAADHVAKAGLMSDARPYRFFVDTRYENPPKEMMADIRKGEIDAGILWGPLAGWYANHDGDKLTIVPLTEEVPKTEKLVYRITMGVRAGETNWKHEINDVIAKRQGDIDAILLSYGLPLLDEDNKLITAPRKGTN
ncbi:MAG: substrate-binding domain-containing protein [Hyphomicrobium sp.]|jgi:quinoprotein dehydrogenase-associated probable ABC transporter substrate-binding protein